jgi:hypothetical protein
MIGTNLPVILQGFIPTILNPTSENPQPEIERTVMEKIIDYSKMPLYLSVNVVAFTLCILFVVFALNVIVFVSCLRQASQQGKILTGIAGLLPIYNVIWLSSRTRVPNAFLIVYSILHVLLIGILAYFLNLLLLSWDIVMIS